MQSGKAQIQEIGGHAAEDQNQIRSSSWCKPFRISPLEVLQSWLINTFQHFLVKNDTREGGGGGLLTFFPWIEGGRG